jgi:hypothetical protein
MWKFENVSVFTFSDHSPFEGGRGMFLRQIKLLINAVDFWKGKHPYNPLKGIVKPGMILTFL